MYFPVCLRNKPSNSVMVGSSRISIVYKSKIIFFALFRITCCGENLQMYSVNAKCLGGKIHYGTPYLCHNRSFYLKISTPSCNTRIYDVTLLLQGLLMVHSTMTDSLLYQDFRLPNNCRKTY